MIGGQPAGYPHAVPRATLRSDGDCDMDRRGRPVLEAVVVVPARNEQELIAACLQALGAQTVGTDAFEVIVVLDGCEDRTQEVTVIAASASGLSLTMVLGPGRGSGAARRTGMDLACARLLDLGRPNGLIATTDADSRPAPDWLARQLAHLEVGAQVVAGNIELDPAEAQQLPAMVLAARERDAAARLRRLHRTDPDAAHHHFAGASLGVTAEAYRCVGGMEPRPALEDEGFADRLARHRIPIVRAPDVIVVTSARIDGRATRGLAVDLAVAEWRGRRRLSAADFAPEDLWAVKGATTVTVIVPTKECAETIGGVLRESVGPAVDQGLIDAVVVVDADSRDGTAQVAAAAGARVIQQDEVAAELGPALGKGDAMWRALLVTGGDIVCFLDGDTRDPDPAHLLGLLGPLLTDPSLSLVKGSFDRPLDIGQGPQAHEGGRVTELMARPLLNLYEPRLAGFAQPLAGEFATRRELLEQIPFPVGYGVEIAVLLDALRAHGLDALAECHLGSRQNRHQPLRELGEMAYAVLAAVHQRFPAGECGGSVVAGGRYLRPWDAGRMAQVPISERPPIREWAAAPADVDRVEA
jgi:glucosyl-3-phosphoglycerate synthase